MNKKIKNATPKEYNGIKFKSHIEVMVYKTLLQYEFNVQYEPTKFIIWKGFKPTIKTYKPSKSGNLELTDKKIIDITYTPDFIVQCKKCVVIIECKGFTNDTYPIKEKMFRKILEDMVNTEREIIFCQIKTKKQLLELIDVIKQIENE